MRKSIIISLTSICIILIGCSIQESEETNVPNIDNSEISVIENDNNDSSNDLYKAFLHNQVPVHINASNDQATAYFTFSSDGDYTLRELETKIMNGHLGDGDNNVEIHLENVEYAYIDCGNDGTQELALHIVTPQGGECWEEYLIIKDFNGSLESVYSQVGWSRSYIHINKYGYIYNDGSGGASYHSFEKYYVDSNGKLSFIYSDSTEAGYVDKDAYNYGLPGLITDSISDTDLQKYGGAYVFLRCCFTDAKDEYGYHKNEICTVCRTEESYVDISTEGYKSISYVPLWEDTFLYEQNSIFRKVADSEYLQFKTLSEIYSMIEEKESSLGLTQDLIDGEEANWILLE